VTAYKILSFMVCDDIRQEKSGKEILIGVYNDTMIVPALPAFMPQLSFRVKLQLEEAGENVSVSVNLPSGPAIFSHTAKIPNQSVTEPTLMNFQLAGVSLPEYGRYTFSFGIDKPAEEIGSFNVRAPANEEERARAQS
jgi:hypothetical protein